MFNSQYSITSARRKSLYSAVIGSRHTMNVQFSIFNFHVLYLTPFLFLKVSILLAFNIEY